MTALMECPIAGLTDIRPLAGMSAHMPVQISAQAKCLTTGLTDIRPLTSMNAHMNGQMSALIECLTTGLTDIRPLVGMNAHMNGQMSALAKCPIAGLTDIRPLAGMSAHMPDQCRRAGERPGTSGAWKHGMTSYMNDTNNRRMSVIKHYDKNSLPPERDRRYSTVNESVCERPVFNCRISEPE
ncbi:hypothetical protein GFV31_25205 [Salmonella enterica]|nr:hypothetical protein [Salmonella enterica]EDL3029746.1 hypothetical protein [Salmonella enterica subsp. enterica serovar Poona]EDK0305173.1 hypothetical protein [Salmonella enterica]EDK0309816.1 hypothetical protein [Salmonella enterica]EDK8574974.1 hypothetical protein [Salmonella enterica]